ncbi:Suppressor of the cold-sensitive snRNP biogenesis mutant brr1-1, partial [Dinochytrium kinnereticum]
MQFLKLIALAVTALLPGSIAAPTLFKLPPGSKIPNQYIIIYKHDANDSLIATHESWLQTAALTANAPLVRRDDLGAFPTIPLFKGFSYTHKFSGSKAFRGYTAKLTPEIAEALKSLPEIALIEQDTVVSINAVQANPPSWGLR